MGDKIKIDLHTHPFRSLRSDKLIQGVRDINKDVLRPLVEAIERAGLRGIAITERDDFNWGWVAALQIKEHFPEKDLLILPGRELEYRGQHYLQIYVPESARRDFTFFQDREWLSVLAHPGHYQALEMPSLSQAQIDLVEGASLRGTFAVAQRIAEERGIPVIETSDAQELDQIGAKSMELEADLKAPRRRR